MSLFALFENLGRDLAFAAREKGGAPAPLALVETERASAEQGALRGETVRFTFPGGRGFRTVLTDGETVAFLRDRVIFDEPRCLYAAFHAAGDVTCNVADKHRLVLRSGEEGIKCFRLLSEADGEDTLEKSGLLLPDGTPPGGGLRYAFYAGLYRYGREQTVDAVFVKAAADRIGAWHIVPGDGWEISDPEKRVRFTVRAERDRLTLASATGEELTVLTL